MFYLIGSFTLAMVTTFSIVYAQSTLVLQEKCAKGAKEYFESRNQDWHPNYVSHYNKKLDKCFILITTVCGGTCSTSMELIDVFERKVYVHFIMGDKCGSKAWVDCEGFEMMGKLCDDAKKCNTWRKCEAVIKPYMEE